MNNQLTAQELNSALWAAADEMRRVMTADVYKDSLNINEDKAKEYANRLYQYQSYLGLSKRPKEEQQDIINHIMKEAENRAVSEAILDYIKEHINITEKDAGRFVANENDLWAGY